MRCRVDPTHDATQSPDLGLRRGRFGLKRLTQSNQTVVMSIFGNLGGVLGNLFAPYGGPQAVLSQALGEMGGVQGVIGKLQQAGLGDQVSSWLGKGPNQPVTPDAIGSALGHGKLGEVAAKLGIPQDQLSELIAHALPSLVDRISPHGMAEPHLMQGGAATVSPLDPAS